MIHWGKVMEEVNSSKIWYCYIAVDLYLCEINVRYYRRERKASFNIEW